MKKILFFISLFIVSIHFVFANEEFEYKKILEKYNEFNTEETEIISLINLNLYYKEKYYNHWVYDKIMIKKLWKNKYNSSIEQIDSKVNSINDTNLLEKIWISIDEKIKTTNKSSIKFYIMNYINNSLKSRYADLLSKNALSEYNKNLKINNDNFRKDEIMIINEIIYMYYKENLHYPNNNDFNNWNLTKYLWIIPEDPLWNISKNWCNFWYRYALSTSWKSYKLASCLESSNNEYIFESKDEYYSNSKDKYLNQKKDNYKIEYNDYYYINWYTNWNKYVEKEENNILESHSWVLYLNWKNITKTYNYNEINKLFTN